MVLNYIWIGFFLIAFVIAVFKLLVFGDYDVFPAMMDSTFSSSKTAFEISLGLTGVLSLWLGVMKVGEKGGVVSSPLTKAMVKSLVGAIESSLFIASH